jgi:hypothetical protein
MEYPESIKLNDEFMDTLAVHNISMYYKRFKYRSEQCEVLRAHQKSEKT